MSYIVIDLHRKGEPLADLSIDKAWTEAARRNLAHLREAMTRVSAHHVEIPFESTSDQWGVNNVEFISDRNTTIPVDLERSRIAVAGIYSRDQGPTFTVDEDVDSLALLGAALTHLVLGATSDRMGIWEGVGENRMPDAFGTIFVNGEGEVQVDMRRRTVVKSTWRMTDEEASLFYPPTEPAPALTQIPEPGLEEEATPAA